MKSLLASLLLVLAIGTPSRAIHLVSSSPATGTAGLGGAITLVLSFDTPLDTSREFANSFAGEDAVLPVQFMLIEPEYWMSLTDFSVNGDFTELNLSLQLAPETDFCLVLGQAFGDDASSLANPEFIFLSTQASLGQFSVGGTVTFSGVVANAMVLLTDQPIFADEPQFLCGTIGGPFGAYEIPFVRPDVCYPVAALDVDGDGQINPDQGVDVIGIYDPDEDGQQDSILVDGNLTGIDFALDLFATMRTAQEALADAIPLALEWDASAQAKVLQTWGGLDEDGAAGSWICMFSAPTMTDALVVYLSFAGVQAEIMPVEGSLRDLPALPQTFLDSATMQQIALDNGGDDFLQLYPECEQSFQAGAQSYLWPEDPTRLLWTAQYFVDLGETQDFLFVVMDLVTGEVLENTKVEPGPAVPTGLSLEHNAPNPFNPDTIIRFNLPGSGRVSLTVHDIMGRPVTTLLDGGLGAGEHRIRFDGSGLASGIYFYTLEYEGSRLTRSMLLVK
ncbi:MAG: T9SS type A sorting domain-containing protein [Calditrichaeota bacterium]|nr:T9SS type A sorting domain-containing protein [Calditrichota bacterium]